MSGRLAVAGLGAVLAVTCLSAAPSASTATLPAAPFPSPGNLTVLRAVLESTRSTTSVPRLSLASRRIPAGSFVVGSVARGSSPTRFLATVAILYPGTGVAPPTGATPGPPMIVQIPQGYRLVGAVQVARDVLYSNRVPTFEPMPIRTAFVLAGAPPPKLPATRILAVAQLLAFERSVKLAEVGLLGFPFVTAEFTRLGAKTLQVTIGLSRLQQVNAVELRFPGQQRVIRVDKPTGTDSVLVGTGVQLIASGGFFDEGLAYRFTVDLATAPRKGDLVSVRASTHYFESSLPFIERFALP